MDKRELLSPVSFELALLNVLVLAVAPVLVLPQPVVLVLDQEVLESVLVILGTELNDAEFRVPVLLGNASIVPYHG